MPPSCRMLNGCRTLLCGGADRPHRKKQKVASRGWEARSMFHTIPLNTELAYANTPLSIVFVVLKRTEVEVELGRETQRASSELVLCLNSRLSRCRLPSACLLVPQSQS